MEGGREWSELTIGVRLLEARRVDGFRSGLQGRPTAVRLEIEEQLAELLFTDDAPLVPVDPTAEAQRSQQAKNKAARKRTDEGLPVSRPDQKGIFGVGQQSRRS